MSEHIYTIPLNDHFSKHDGCPLCSLFDMLEKNEIETITGASMMEPSVRVKTNSEGFCHKHFELMLTVGKRLPIALIMQSHLEEIRDKTKKKNGKDTAKFFAALEQNCYVCNRIKKNMDSIFSNFFHLYKNEKNFRERFLSQEMFCLPHYRELLEYGQKFLSKKEYDIFAKELQEIENRYLETLQGDIDWFCKKFDYRYKEEDWKNSRDAIERTVYTLTGIKIKKEENE